MNADKFGLLFYLTVAIYLTSAELPTEVPKCLAGDVVCIKNTINFILARYSNGNPAFGLINLHSIQLTDVVISKPKPKSPVQLNFKYNTLTVMGFENASVIRVVGFEADPEKSKYEVHLQIPILRMVGEYEAGGKILLLPITGGGHSEMVLEDVRVVVKIKTHLETINGKNYIQLSKIKSTMNIGGLRVNLENLFGQKELSDAMNEIINANWHDVWAEVQDGVNEAFSNVAVILISNVLRKLPFDDFYFHK